ncbi:hypothetical protein NQ176_g1349 [Zarea fungicola]|uniref:Uncharacterized protein n=1 Tax=Zarea fungicola TaxID=93591 RepID=A0ACC1NT61_9HYPO|nr:hypothetical protein NQ176_g1349 [Lecanicillium fungicola]
MAANQSKRRIEKDTALDGCQNYAKKWKVIYEPLSQNPPSTRFLRIKRAANENDAVSCEIFQATFAENRRFEALSYRWGDELADKPILLNGVEKTVKQNLSDALLFLRNRRPCPDTLYWIDALCINQDDVAERNEQVKLMRHIYFRASTVLVWLGKMYDKYEAMLPELRKLRHAPAAEPSGKAKPVEKKVHLEQEAAAAAGNDAAWKNGEKMAKELYRDEYWNRVWIVQEIGRAKQIEVCFGNASIHWSAFINLFNLHNVGDGGPLKLNTTRAGKEHGSCQLIQLLQHYKNAQCKDPKDKVYGLIGLAQDAQRFPLDYNKSLLQIWTDFMEFANEFGLLKNQDVVAIGGLVKFTLMGRNAEPLKRIIQPYAPAEEPTSIMDTPDSPKVFQIPAKMLGCIQYIGPSPDEIVSDPFKQEAWEQHIQANFQTDTGFAHSESDMLLRTILDPARPELSMSCFAHASVVKWTPGNTYGSMLEQFKHNINATREQSDEQDGLSEHGSTVFDPGSSVIRLYHLFYRHQGFSWKTGLAPGNARRGDLICWVQSSRRAIILRPLRPLRSHSTDWCVQAVGTATVAGDLQGISLRDHADRFQSFDRSDATPVYLDSMFIFLLLE